MIRSETVGPVTYLTVCRSGESNAFTSEMVRTLRDEVRHASRVSTIIVLQSEGPDFSIGRDRSEPKTGDVYATYLPVSELNLALSTFPGVVVTAVQGRAMGFGVGLVMRSDLVIASEQATFSLDEVKHGIPPMFLMSAISEHLAPKHALDLVLTSRRIDAPEALSIGLVSRVVPAEMLRHELETIVRDLTEREPAVLKACKRYVNDIKQVHGEARHSFALSEQTRFSLSNR